MKRWLSYAVVSVLSAGAAHLSQASEPGKIDLAIEHGSYADPEPAGRYTYNVVNHSDAAARDVRVTAELPAHSFFFNMYVDRSGPGEELNARCETPPSGESGSLEVLIPTLPPNSLVEVTVNLSYDETYGAAVPLRLDVASSVEDPNPADNSYVYDYFVPHPEVATATMRWPLSARSLPHQTVLTRVGGRT